MSVIRTPVDWQAIRQLSPTHAVPDGLPGTWWVAHAKPRCEKRLAAELAAREVPSYVPLRQRTTRNVRARREIRSLLPLFTGYVFFNATETQRIAALTTNKIVTLLPVPDQQGLVAQLRHIHQLLSQDRDVECGPVVHEGDWVQVVSGPLTGIVGRVVRMSSRWKLAINVHILSQSVSVELAREMVERVEPPPGA